MPDRTRRPPDARTAAEAAFRKATTKPIPAPARAPVLPGTRESVTLRIDRAVLEHFQSGGPGWQDRINDALVELIGTGKAIKPDELNASNDE
ncbi:MAG TPA: BrnA antitoxin family protein [Hyphomicrobiales bacterium]|nr:BrnA antitoxin family protein [Hyphomicrobiales bacterium]